MTIEIKQISVRTMIIEDREKKNDATAPQQDNAALKRQILKECRQLIMEIITAKQER